MMEERTDVKSLFFQELDQQLREKGLKAFRSGQIFQWIHEKQADSFADMTNLPKDLRQRLMEEYDLVTLKQEDVRISKIDGTRKYLFGLKDGHVIESVWMKYRHGNSVCISSQVDAAWDAVSVPPPWTGWSGTLSRRRCWIRSTGSRRIRGRG